MHQRNVRWRGWVRSMADWTANLGRIMAAGAVLGLLLVSVRVSPDMGESTEGAVRMSLIILPAAGAAAALLGTRALIEGSGLRRDNARSRAVGQAALFLVSVLLAVYTVVMHWASLTSADGWLLALALILFFPAMAGYLVALVGVPYALICVLRAAFGRVFD